MKYFTIEWYKEMQINGFLVFHKTKEDWEEDVAWYETEGMDFEELCRVELEFRKHDLLKFLPESFYPYIYDGTIKSRFPSIELRKMAEQWTNDYNERMEIVKNEYQSNYHSIKNSLQKNVVQFYEQSVHDAIVISFEIPNKDTFIMTLNCSGCYHYYTDIKLTFKGVRDLLLPNELIGSWWIYQEIYATKAGFELHILLDCPLAELILIAEDVLIEVLA